jgi:hypothetical protein
MHTVSTKSDAFNTDVPPVNVRCVEFVSEVGKYTSLKNHPSKNNDIKAMVVRDNDNDTVQFVRVSGSQITRYDFECGRSYTQSYHRADMHDHRMR